MAQCDTVVHYPGSMCD